ncbi:THUMP domain-containing class I SAM-dependent RNA methyltransferase [Clostridium luticellarii]|jgi:putative N6-adenine-specific DNA methylase|uniref:THUMP domain-containing class I SAM-dependent RNA methyltransferase n=1 Tax=Clostridium luticellarii TaxID=1691940 RepID=UPI002356246B|nr:class I SAM-dependent RNA methyltransferase [Clostridium luticellarii]MCI1944960.1 class I SAM-dependent RNA methyltransferase [Clostridium luticellarii]MCI1967890.1 class I SAM-dependent RNA methyltransferase [Clostridium luticellarii]
MEYTLIATSTFGLESVVAKELKNLGYENLKVENGRVIFHGDEMDIITCNLWLRTADRVLICMTQFKAESFEELFQGTLSVDWGSLMTEDAFMHVTGKSVKSKLHSVPDCQSIVKKAIVESMKNKYNIERFEETGAEYRIEVGILKDIVTLTVDTSGEGLHKRGYRKNSGEAPIKETLAAAMVLLSRWDPSIILADPMCGSGTIAIEAALIGKNIAPGLNRNFVSEQWRIIPEKLWKDLRKFALKSINNKEFRILASDIDGRVIRTAMNNAEKAGVDNYIAFQKIPVQKFTSKKSGGFIISNPPYGERLGKLKEAEKLYEDIGKVFSKLKEWNYFIITAHDRFEKYFGKKSNKNRKLYNGRLKCYYYQYFNGVK